MSVSFSLLSVTQTHFGRSQTPQNSLIVTLGEIGGKYAGLANDGIVRQHLKAQGNPVPNSLQPKIEYVPDQPKVGDEGYEAGNVKYKITW